ncbi:amidohydrolase [Nakamurella endophytica]|uniref:N-acyl-L-amino acid amidohydrolase n=1 Tax=Nakamurella endophytica TaxID=1748367 RepID=A0A917SY30_9ACTN|nr:amidohydrolase [Nakamurella endophytica]GGM01919.1 N-acyl-L-amino acid amidohydrolase [Nakamurella endophytica]
MTQASSHPDVPADPGAGRGPVWLDGFLAAELPALVALRRDVHAHPEVSRAESATSALILRTLARYGIRGTVLPGGTGVVADIGAGDRVVALRADIDALPLPEHSGLPWASTVPGVCHACGHDVHLTALLGAAGALQSSGVLPGRVRLIFQPAEEVMPGGAHDVVAAGVMQGVEQAYALHCDPRLPVGTVGCKSGAITSTSDLVALAVSGPGGHTARPHLTADLVYALGTVITGLPGLLSRRMDPRSVPVMVWGAVAAGSAPNAVPQSGLLRGTLRMMDRSGWEAAEPLVREIVADLLAPTRASYTLSFERGVPPVENDPACTDLLRTAVTAAVGEGGVGVTAQSTGAEDFAVLLDHAPGALARLGVWDGVSPMVDLHSPTFRADERAIPVGIRLLVHTALAALTGPPR